MFRNLNFHNLPYNLSYSVVVVEVVVVVAYRYSNLQQVLRPSINRGTENDNFTDTVQ